MKGRASISASWHDRFGRTVDGLRVGTNDEETFDRGGTSDPPTPSETELVSAQESRRGG